LHWLERSFPREQREKQKGACKVWAPFFALTIVSAIALVAAPPVRAQAIPDPGRSPDAAFVAKASDATVVDAELATLALSRARAAGVKAFAKQVLDTHAALARELGAMGRTSAIAGAPRAEPVSTSAPAPQAASADAATAEGPPPDGMKAVAVLRSQPPAAFDAAFVAAMIASREAAVALFEAESRDGRDAEIKEWAARQLPALREQLVAARALRPRSSS
jgi:predicted outer membrane protein